MSSHTCYPCLAHEHQERGLGLGHAEAQPNCSAWQENGGVSKAIFLPRRHSEQTVVAPLDLTPSPFPGRKGEPESSEARKSTASSRLSHQKFFARCDDYELVAQIAPSARSWSRR